MREVSPSSRELSAVEERVLVQCSLFHGSFTTEAIEHVLSFDDLSPDLWPLDVVMSLLKRGLIETFEPLPHHRRFSLSAIAIGYAARARKEVPTVLINELRAKHAAFYSRLGSESRIESLSKHHGGHRIHILMLEQANLRAALEYALESNHSKSAAGLLLAYSALVNLKGPHQILTSFCERILASTSLATEQRVRVLIEYARALRISVGTQSAKCAVEEALELAQQLGNAHQEALALGVLSIISLQEGQPELGLEQAHRSLAIHRTDNNRIYEGINLADIGIIQTTLGNLEQARSCYEQALVLHREVGNERCEGIAMTNLSLIMIDLNEKAAAIDHLEEAIVLLRRSAHRRLEGCALGNLGDLYMQEGRLQEAQEYLETAIEIASEVGYRVPEGAFLGSLCELHIKTGQLVDAQRCLEQGEFILRQANDQIELTKLLARKALLALAKNDHSTAQGAYEESTALAAQLRLTKTSTAMKLLDKTKKLLSTPQVEMLPTAPAINREDSKSQIQPNPR